MRDAATRVTITAGGMEPLDDELSVEQLEQLLAQVADDAGRAVPAQTFDDGSGLPMVDLEEALADSGAESPDQTLTRLRPDWQEEWSEEQVPYVRLLIERCRKVVVSTTGVKARRRLVRWCFGRLPGWGGLPVTFDQCCYQLRARPYVVQAMLHHQWFRHAIVLPEALPILSDPVHEGILTEAISYSFDAGAAVVETVWMHPSMFTSEVIQGATAKGITRDEAESGLGALVEAGLLGLRGGRVWFTGRSPEFMAKRRTSFAQSFIEPQYQPAPSATDALSADEAAILFGKS